MPILRSWAAVLILTLLLLNLAPASCLWAGAAGDPAEYMIYQYPDVALVVKVDVPEAEFSMRVWGPDSELLADAGIPGRRLGPVFQYLAPSDLPRQLMIEVTPARPLPRSTIDMQVIQLESNDPNARNLASAYRLLSDGAAAERGDDANTWVVKAYSLSSAAERFAALGMEEMRLWSEYSAAHLVLYRLGDRVTAMEMAREIQRAAVRAGFARVELAALAFEGEALVQPIDSGDLKAAGGEERTLAVFARVADLAEQQRLAGVQGRALYYAGLELERRGRSEEALEKYSAALDVSAGSGDPDLLSQLRNASASLQESMGRTGGAIEMLDQLAAGLEEGEQDATAFELSEGLYDKGRLLNANFRYAEAAVELRRALALQRGSRAQRWGPTGLELAWALYSLGDAEGAAVLIQESLPRTPLRDHRELLARAYGSLARISAVRGEYRQASEARQRQREFAGSTAQAALLFSMATDARLRHGPGSGEAERLLRRSREAAMVAGDALSERRAGLQLCLLAAEQGRSGRCADSEIGAMQRTLLDAGLPRLAAEAALARARILRAQGSDAAAWQEMRGLLDDVRWLRHAVPGVLGAWYWVQAPGIFREYLQLAVAVGGRSPQPGRGGPLPLLALEHIRMLEAAAAGRASEPLIGAVPDEELRNLLARREAAVEAGSPNLAAEARQALAAARRECRQCLGPGRELMSADRLGSLLAGLGPSEAVLAYDFSGATGRALLAVDGGISVVELSRSADLMDSITELRGDLARAAEAVTQSRLETLGRLLLAPLGNRLPRRVYLLPMGPLRAFPLDALRTQGRYLAERHEVVSLAGLQALAGRGVSVAEDYRNRVFLAGDPRRDRDPFSLEVVISPELSAVTELFVGPGLQVVQGIALQKDEFEDERFTGAALIHLAAPGRVDLASPEESYLTLSGGDRLSDENMLRPHEVHAFDLSASLVVLSQTVVVGDSRSPLDSRTALVSDFLDRGAASVIVSLWPVAEADGAAFWSDFYRNLGRESDIERALAATRRSLMESGALLNFERWAGFQLFIR
jgi:CHAT domain-containing protein/tetratricopeptide (TPR) repeat protein